MLSIMGLYLTDNTIFNDTNFPIPEYNDTPVFDREIFKNTLLIECGELGLTYPDLDFFKLQFKTWALKNADKWVKLYRASIAEFNPVENYDRTEETTFTHGKTESHSGGTSSTTTATTTNTGGDTVAHHVTGMNSTDTKLAYNDVTTLGSGNTVNGSVTNTDTTVITNSGNDVNRSRIHGNIGVTTAPKMLEEYREYASHNVIDDVVADFKHDFCILIY